MELDKKIKGFNSQVKDLDDKVGYVEAYANAYNNVDSDNEVSLPGSFTKTVSENFKKLRVYKNHNTTKMVGVPKKIDAHDPYGLLTGTQFNMDTDLGKDMFNDVKLIVNNNQDADLSIGFRVVKETSKDNIRYIQEYALYEYSFLTSWGANPLAVVTGLKSANTPELIIKHLTEMYNLPYSDSRLVQVESILKSLVIEPKKITQDAEPMELINYLKSLSN